MDQECKSGLLVATWVIALILLTVGGLCSIITATGRMSHDWDCSNHGGPANLGQTATITLGTANASIQLVCKDGYKP